MLEAILQTVTALSRRRPLAATVCALLAVVTLLFSSREVTAFNRTSSDSGEGASLVVSDGDAARSSNQPGQSVLAKPTPTSGTLLIMVK